MLVDDDPAEGCDAGRDPEGVLDGEDKFAGLLGGLVADAEIRCFGRRGDVVGRLGFREEGGEGEKKDEKAHRVNYISGFGA